MVGLAPGFSAAGAFATAADGVVFAAPRDTAAPRQSCARNIARSARRRRVRPDSSVNTPFTLALFHTRN